MLLIDLAGDVRLYRGLGNTSGFYGGYTVIGRGWNAYGTTMAGGDQDGDGRTDIFTRQANGYLYLYRSLGTPAGWLGPDRIAATTSMSGLTLVGSGDYNNDTNSDAVVRNASGTFTMCPGTGTGGVGTCAAFPGGAPVLAPGTYPSIALPKNIDGTGTTRPQNDLVALNTTTSQLVLYSGAGTGTGTGFATTGTTIASTVPGNQVFAPGDWDGDGFPDLIVRNTTTGDLWLYRGLGTQATLAAPTKIGTGWGSVGLIAPGDWDGDGKPDMILQRLAGWELFQGSGSSFYFPYPMLTGSLPAYSSVTGGGDWNKDGKPDILVINTSNQLEYVPDPGWPTANQATQETITNTFTGRTGQPLAAQGDSGLDYVPKSTYDDLGRLSSRVEGYVGAMRRSFDYGATVTDPLMRLTQIKTEVNGAYNYTTGGYTGGTLAQDDRYGYDAIGNVRAVADDIAKQQECFTLDNLDRLTNAHTYGYTGAGPAPNVSPCAPADTTGPVPYNTTYAYSPTGNMTANAGLTYCYPATGAARPHAVTSRQNTACGTTPTTVDTFGYNANGQMTTRILAGTVNTLQWDPLGRLAWSLPGSSANNYANPPAGSTSYVYDASGQRLARVSPDGSRTVYLDNLEVRSTPATNQGGNTGSTTVRTWGFEGGTTENFASWYNATTVDNPATGAQPRTGSRSLHVVAGDQFWGIADNISTTVTGGGSYTLTAYAKNGDGGANAGMTALIRWFSATNGGLGETVVGTQTAVTGAWTLISGNTVTAPQDAAKAQIEFTSDSSAAGRVFYLDDISLLTQTGGTSGGGSTGGTTVKAWGFDAGSLDGLASWYGINTTTPGATAITTAQAHTGTSSWQLTASDAFWAIQDNNWPGQTITAGTTYNFTAWAKAASSTGTCQLQLYAAWIDANGNQIGADMPIGSPTSDTASSWTQLSGTATAPTSPTPAVSVVLRVSTGNSAVGQVHYLDDLSITTGGTPTPSGSVPLVSYTRYYTIASATIAQRRGDPTGQTLTWLAGNQQGSLTIANPGGTNIINRQRYQPYGANRNTADQIPQTDKGFLGQTEDAGSGLLYLNQRYYDPVLARFVSVDPLAAPTDAQSLNPYSYALGNPSTYADPSGLLTCFGGCGSDADKAAREASKRAQVNALNRPVVVPPGSQAKEFSFQPFSPGSGMVRINSFISAEAACAIGLCFNGDGRGFSNEYNAPSRARIYLNLECGCGLVVIQPSSRRGGSFQDAEELTVLTPENPPNCNSLDVSCQASVAGSPYATAKSLFSFDSAPGSLSFQLRAKDSAAPEALKPATPSLYLAMSISENKDGSLNVQYDRTSFPSLEVYHEVMIRGVPTVVGSMSASESGKGPLVGLQATVHGGGELG